MGFLGRITGKDKRRQKRKYNQSVSDYENYDRQAQSDIDRMRASLEQNRATLRNLDEQKHYSGLKAQQLHGSVYEYHGLLGDFERQRENIEGEANSLQAAFKSFTDKVPALSDRISELEQLPLMFQNLYDITKSQKERLSGLTAEEAEGAIRKHRTDVENLKRQRGETEVKIKSFMDEVTRQHSGLTGERQNLERRFEDYKQKQDRYLNDTIGVNNQRNNLERIIKEYQTEQDKINSEYQNHKNIVQGEEQNIQNYITSAQSHLNNLGDAVNYRARKYKKEASRTGLTQGIALGAATYGLGAGLSSIGMEMLPWQNAGAQMLVSAGSGLRYVAPLLGGMHYLRTANGARATGGFGRVSLTDNTQPQDLSHLARNGLSSPKTNIPELGNLRQSLSHFDMPIIPNIKDLPKLNDALGKITSLKDIEALGLGLPSLTSASGKKYSHEVLYDPKFLKKLKRVSRNWGMNYLGRGMNHLRNNNAANLNNLTPRAAYA